MRGGSRCQPVHQPKQSTDIVAASAISVDRVFFEVCKMLKRLICPICGGQVKARYISRKNASVIYCRRCKIGRAEQDWCMAGDSLRKVVDAWVSMCAENSLIEKSR